MVILVGIGAKRRAERFPQQALASVPVDRAANFSAGNHGPGHVIGGQQVNYGEASNVFGATCVDLVKFLLFRQ
jgi:hypothetical protein